MGALGCASAASVLAHLALDAAGLHDEARGRRAVVAVVVEAAARAAAKAALLP